MSSFCLEAHGNGGGALIKDKSEAQQAELGRRDLNEPLLLRFGFGVGNR